MARAEIGGERVGQLTALTYDAERKAWLCRCECGGTCYVRITAWRRKQCRSCGCQQYNGANHRTHGMKQTPEYRTWNAMKRRCLNPRASQWAYYGGRGIRICDRWLNDFAAFYADMGPKPSRQHSIDRIDNDGNYEPGNCRWATPEEQASNSTAARVIEFRGQRDTMAGWARRMDVPFSAFALRLRRGWSVEKALTIPLRATKRAG